MSNFRDREGDRRVLTLIGGGIIVVLLAINCHRLRAWHGQLGRKRVFGDRGRHDRQAADVLSALIALSSNRQIERVTDQLAVATPPGPQSVTIDKPADQPVPVEAK